MKIAVTMFDVKTNQYTLNAPYIKYIQSAGFTPIIITPDHNQAEMIAMCDGLLLPGGIDIDPIYYKEDNYGCMYADPDKDEFERKLLYMSVDANKPVFGICRGFQLMAREWLHVNNHIQDLADFEQHVQEHSLVEARAIPRTSASHLVMANTKRMYGKDMPVGGEFEIISVNSMHHQALVVKKDKVSRQALLNAGLNVNAYTTFGKADNAKGVIVEAGEFKFKEGLKLRGVQWHPEELSLKNPRDIQLIKRYFEGFYATKNKPVENQKPMAPPLKVFASNVSSVGVTA